MSDYPKRCGWAEKQISNCFNISSNMVNDFLSNRTNQQQFLELLQPGGPQRLVVFYQAASSGGPIKLFFGDPQVYAVKTKTKCCYFLRNCDPSFNIAVDIDNDSSLTAGVLADRAWEELHRSLTSMFLPVLQTRTGWGDADSMETKMFLNGMEHFSNDLSKAVEGLFGGLKLEQPEQRHLDEVMSRRSSDGQTAAISHLKKLVLAWSDQINESLQFSMEALAQVASNSSSDEDASVDHLLKSPIFELEYWRHRTQSLTSIVQQLQHPLMRGAVSTLSSRAKVALAGSRRAMQQQGQEIQQVLTQWKDIDSKLTESTIEAKDNFKYLGTMKKFFEPLSTGIPPKDVASTLPALLNSIKMIFTISRYFGTSNRILKLFAKITHQMIRNCQKYAQKKMTDIIQTKSNAESKTKKSASEKKDGDEEEDDEKPAAVASGTAEPSMWDIDDDSRDEILSRCMRLNELYQAEYFEVKKTMEQSSMGVSSGEIGGSSILSSNQSASPSSSPKGGSSKHGSKMMENSGLLTSSKNLKVFGPDDHRIVFGEFDMFCRRLIKLEDLFSTIKQFQPLLASKQLEMRALVNEFKSIVNDLKKKRHNLLKYENAQFDRDYLDFSVRYSELLDSIQHFVNSSFSDTLNVRDGLELLHRFNWMKSIERLSGDLNNKSAVIFQQYGIELDEVEKLYERNKKNPPIGRNLPPVAGHISWSRQLLNRIESPMIIFKKNHDLLRTKDAKRIIKKYNKMARALVGFEYLWYQAWKDSIESAKAGLQATLLVRHPDDGMLYVNFDDEILQLIRETKCLERMGIVIPESAKVVYLQHKKFVNHCDLLNYLLRKYKDIKEKILPVASKFISPLDYDVLYALRPGLVQLNWTSMHIQDFESNLKNTLQRFSELVNHMNDITDNRIEKNLLEISRTMLVNLPDNRTFTLDEFVELQQNLVNSKAGKLQGMNVQIESAVDDMINLVKSYPLNSAIEGVSSANIEKVREHYNHFMYRALLNATKQSLYNLKKRLSTSKSGSHLAALNNEGTDGGPSMTFHHLVKQVVTNKPCFEVSVILATPNIVVSPSLDSVQSAVSKAVVAILRTSMSVKEWGREGRQGITFHSRVTKDIEIVRMVLLLTGGVMGTRNEVQKFLLTFSKYDWLWSKSKKLAYDEFLKTEPNLDDYDKELKRFQNVEEQIMLLNDSQIIGPLVLDNTKIKTSLIYEAKQWMIVYSDNLHTKAREMMAELFEYMKSRMSKLNSEVTELESLKEAMGTLEEIRKKESTIESESMAPILNVYEMLDRYLPSDALTSKEQDQKSVIRSTWRKLVLKSMNVMDKLRDASGGFRTNLNKGITEFKVDLERFRNDFESHGPIVPGIAPSVAMERLKRFREEFSFRERKYELNKIGEQLFAMPESKYPTLTKTRKDLNLLTQLYDLYAQVLETADDWNNITWSEFGENKDIMSEKIEGYDLRCNKMPRKLRDWDAYKTLRHQIDDFKAVLPLLEELSKPSIEERHWNKVQALTGSDFDPFAEDLELKTLLDADLVRYNEDVEEITEGADKERSIRNKLADNVEIWSKRSIEFQGWKARGVPTMRGVPLLLEELEEAQMELQTLLTMRYCLPYKEEIQLQLQMLSETTETCELWLKVQMMWGNLESVFLGGDIARQLPREAKKFSKIDKDWQKLMTKADDTKIATECAANEVLKAQLPPLYADLEMCQRALEGYLEQKRNAFPRFYFCSNPVLLQILSQSSDPTAMQAYYEKVFDAISSVTHNKKDKSIITEFKTRVKGQDEIIPFSSPVHAKGNVEDWLASLLGGMRATMKDLTRACAEEVPDISLSNLKQFVWRSTGQFSLMGLQLKWTSDQQDALDLCLKAKHAMRDVARLHTDLLFEMSSWSLDKSLNRMERMKVETMILIQVHQKDVTDELVDLYKKKELKNANSFDWLRQARFAWQPDGEPDVVDDDGCMVISVTDVDFQYQYEYLGIKGRLCITPLTDRCYITLAQALGMYFGGAPAGPAGTGKTETVKDMGRALGIYVVVTNCTDQMSYKSAGKIFKGLCMSGLWGCFDEFNRIKLPVLSVVAQQVLAINNAKRSAAPKLQFPGDPDQIGMNPSCGFFITMNPGYAGRQELPENLKALFRTVAMMVPDFEIIIKVTLSAVGYAEFSGLSRKFARLYDLSKEQLSKQNHYDFGLRNILSVLRTGGQNKRNELDKDEYEIMYRTLRDMNLSKLVSQDVPLFLSLLRDLFPAVESPPDSEYPDIEAAVKKVVNDRKLIHHTTWVKKVVQLYETVNVRHGLMVIGASGGGKSEMYAVLMQALSEFRKVPYRMQKYNPKAVRAQELYGEVDPLSGEWTTGVFAAIWAKANQRANKFDTWILADGPVDAIWIEDLNTVLDDNRILTLANGDRLPMTDNCKIMFENEQLDNASPATVSRCGIVYVDECELDWWPVCQAWVQQRPISTQLLLNQLFIHYVGVWSKVEPGHMFDFLSRNCTPVMSGSRVGVLTSTFRLLTGILEDVTLKEPADPNSKNPTSEMLVQLERLFIYCLVWTVGGLLEPEDRTKFSNEIYRLCNEERAELYPLGDGSVSLNSDSILPKLSTEQTLYEFYVDTYSFEWKLWRPPEWEYPTQGNVEGEQLDFSNLLVPTMDSTRAEYIIATMHKQKHDVLLVGGPGTAKTSICLMFFQKMDPELMGLKAVNFSFLTQMIDVQMSIEESLEKRGGKKFGPTGGRKLTVFFDDISMPEINEWRDQPTLEIVRQVVELDSFAFLDKDKRGEMKIIEDTQYIGAMGHPGGGRNDIPNRLKRQFLLFNVTLPAIASIDDMFGQMLRGRFPKDGGGWSRDTLNTVNKLTEATIDLHQKVKAKMLPTPAKFHYIFNLRDLSRVFQGLLLTPLSTIKTGGSQCPTDDCTLTLVMCWKHECERVFCDKLTNSADKAWYLEASNAQTQESFPEVCKRMVSMGPTTMSFVDFWREDVYDEDGVLVTLAPKVYEPGGDMNLIKERVLFFMKRHNNGVKSGQLNLVLFDDALGHLLRISRILGVPRGSCLLVGVGGSGKQSLTRLSAYIARHDVFQITLTKTYNVASLLDDIRELYKLAGPQQKKVTFLITDSEIKDERFLLYFNSILMTGDIGGLFAKEEIMGMCADLQVKFEKDRPNLHPTPDNLRQFFIDTVRDNLHLVLCMSPANPLFPVRAQRFPGIINGVTIDWFLAWPQEALVEGEFMLLWFTGCFLYTVRLCFFFCDFFSHHFPLLFSFSLKYIFG